MNEKYKATLRIPTDMYAYIEVQVEDNLENIVEKYREFMKFAKGGVGLEKKDMDRVLDRYIFGDESMEIEEYEAMDTYQQDLIQAIKRSRNRVKNKNATNTKQNLSK